ncbi:MAG: AraC family transcriptional regulator [Solirubrobacteraceae bacterium MAG38_C4-C5]|nr:AraC family transcriptional regulator [Candidatus Siliceabacter maunaloa]
MSAAVIACRTTPTGHWEVLTRAPHPALAAWVRRYQGYREWSSQPFRRREAPRGIVALIVSFGDPIRVLDGATRGTHVSFVTGLDERAALTEYTGHQHGIEVNLSPPGAHMVLGVPMHEVAGRCVALEDVLGAAGRALPERLAAAPGWDARFALLDRLLAGRLAAARPASPDVLRAWALLEGSHGCVTVETLARELRCSRRHLAARFREQVGLPPKTVARILRFERATALLRCGDDRPDWAGVAAECGYFDQSHFNRDFKAFAGVTPTRFAAALLPDGLGVSG